MPAWPERNAALLRTLSTLPYSRPSATGRKRAEGRKESEGEDNSECFMSADTSRAHNVVFCRGARGNARWEKGVFPLCECAWLLF